MTGFRIDRLVVTGESLSPASIEFFDGCNLVIGPSNTGKTFVVDAIDYMLGGSDKPEEIDEARGYDSVYLQITTREPKPRTIVLNRGLLGGGLRIAEVRYDDITQSTAWIRVGVKHSKRSTDTVSSLLLGIAGFKPAMIRSNKFNELVELSFRTISHFFVVKEERIFQKTSPIFPVGGFQKTRARSAFNFILTGSDDRSLVQRDRDDLTKAGEVARKQVLESLIAQLSEKISAPPTEGDIDETLRKIRLSIQLLQGELKSMLEQLRDYESRRQENWDLLQNFGSRRIVVKELLIRFRLLEDQYRSDLARLDFILEGDAIVSQLETVHCPLCGMVTNASDRPTSVNATEDIASVPLDIACRKEASKILAQLHDLAETILQLEKEDTELVVRMANAKSSVDSFDQLIRQKLSPQLLDVQDRLSSSVAYQRDLIRYQVLSEQLESLRSALVTSDLTDSDTSEEEDVQIFDGKSLYDFCDELRSLLDEWSYPDLGTIHFDTRYDVSDVVIAGKPRRANGKGVRALTHAAFIIAVMNHCVEKSLAHSQMIVIDSPLTTYKQGELREAGDEVPKFVQESFYDSIARTPKSQQIIVIENDNRAPSEHLQKQMHVIAFHGAQRTEGRKGFFPGN